MQPGMQTGVASLGLLALMFLLGTYLAVVTWLAAGWEKTRCPLPAHHAIAAQRNLRSLPVYKGVVKLGDASLDTLSTG